MELREAAWWVVRWSRWEEASWGAPLERGQADWLGEAAGAPVGAVAGVEVCSGVGPEPPLDMAAALVAARWRVSIVRTSLGETLGRPFGSGTWQQERL